MANNAAYYHWWKNYWTARSAGVGAFYVRPSGGSYGVADGTSYATAWDGFSSIDWSAIPDDGVLYVAGTHTETLTVGKSNVTIRGDYSESAGVIDGENSLTRCLLVQQNNVSVYNITLKNGVADCLYNGAVGTYVYGLIGDNSGNQVVQNEGVGIGVTGEYVNCILSNGSDDGISLHDDAVVIARNCNITDCAQGVNGIGTSNFTAYNCTFENNGTSIVTGNLGGTDWNAYNCIFISGGVTSNSAIGLNVYNSRFVDSSVGSGDVTVNDSYFTGNSQVNNISTSSKTAIVNRCYFDDCQPTTGSILQASTTGNLYVNYSVIRLTIDKYAMTAGGLGDFEMNNCSIYGGGSVGRGIFTNGRDALVSNTIITNCKNGIVAANSTCTADYCNFYNVLTKIFNSTGGTCVVTNEVVGDPLLVDPANGDFSVGIGSSAIDSGDTLTEATGINTADWGDSSTVPTVITKEQIAPWDIGAYVS